MRVKSRNNRFLHRHRMASNSKSATTLAGILLGIFSTQTIAHVGLEKKEAVIGSSYKGILTVPHGCAGSPTTKLSIDIPEGIIAVKPMPKPGWEMEIVRGPYQRSYDFMHGVKLGEGIKQIVWKGGKLADEYYDEFVFTGFIANTFKSGEVLAFPVLQTCERGAENWSEVAGPGQDPHHLKSPAPLLRLMSASSDRPTFAKNGIVVARPWARATPTGAKVGAVYFTLENLGSKPDRLLSVSGNVAEKIEIHEMAMSNAVMIMRQIENGLAIESGKTIEFAPNGHHLMLKSLSRPLKSGETFPLSLEFEHAGTIDITVEVVGVGGTLPSTRSGKHDHHKM